MVAVSNMPMISEIMDESGKGSKKPPFKFLVFLLR
jgi:hypothetical protein